MSTQVIRRILVAMDASQDSQVALEAAASLAEALEAELIGIFVEDINLLRMAQLPYAQEVRFPVAVTQRVDKPVIERQMRLQAARARHQLIAAAEQRKLSWSFSVSRGTVSAELLSAAVNADLIALGRAGRSMAQTLRLGSTARTAIARAARSVLLMHHGVDLHRPVLLLYDGSEESERALALAVRLAQVSGQLRVLLCVDDDGSAKRCEEHIRQQAQDVEVTFRRLVGAEPSNIAYIIKLSHVELLVLGSSARLPGEVIQAMLDELENPVLLVR